MTLIAPPNTAPDEAVESVTEAPANWSLKPVIDIIPAAAYDNGAQVLVDGGFFRTL